MMLPVCRTGKMCFDKRGAQGAKNKLARDGRGRLAIYLCPECNYWHLTHVRANRDRRWRNKLDRRMKEYGGDE